MEMAFADSAEVPFSLDRRADPISFSGTFMPHSDTLPMALGTDMGLTTPETFQQMSGFAPPLANIPEDNSFLAHAWPPQFDEITSVPHEKTLTRKDYSKMAGMCVSL
jgi:hypothetical protein